LIHNNELAAGERVIPGLIKDISKPRRDFSYGDYSLL